MVNLQPSVVADCNIYTGPAGSAECVKLDGYNQHQWAYCLTDSYIKQKSAGRHRCENFLARYCYYQCQMEMHSIRYGDVSADCVCQEGDTKKSTLPTECYSPPGNNCEWYRNCLHKYKDCSKTSSNYAIDYGYYFCKAYEKSYSKFTQKGRSWVDATRKCLQVSLVPVLRLNNKPSCFKIQKRAFDSHTCCYVAGSSCARPGTVSVCLLPLSDLGQIVTTVYESFLPFSKHGDVCKSLEGLISTMQKCPSQYSQSFLTWIDVELFKVPKIVNDITTLIVDRVTAYFAKKVLWRVRKLCWVGELIRSVVDREKREIGSGQDSVKLRIHLWQTPGSDSSVLKDGVKDLLVATQRGEINFQDDDKLKTIVQMKSAAVCKDSNCVVKEAPAIAPPIPNGGTITRSSIEFALIMTLFNFMLNC